MSSQSPNDIIHAALMRRRIQYSLTTGLVLFAVLAIAAALFLILKNAGDASAASAMRAIIYVAATSLGLVVVCLLWQVSQAVLAFLEPSDKSARSESGDHE